MAKDLNMPPSVEFLKEFADAWNRHDLDGVMACMASDGIFVSSDGTRHEGADAVRRAFAEVIEGVDELAFTEDEHFVSGDRGLSQWRLTGVAGDDGTRLDVRGCDLFVFRDGRIAVKDSYLK